MQEEPRVGQYFLVRKIGEGGMAEVWEGRHVHLDRRVAVKFLLPKFGGIQDLQQRFLNEAKCQAYIQHQNVVPALDFFQIEGISYLVMQYVEGQDLYTRLRPPNPPLSLDEILAISWDVLSALGHAHSLGVIHRDVKPANIMLERSGGVMLMDFGIAKALQEERSATLVGTSMGTPDYMSPEQIRSTKAVDARTDIYSFGCVLYAMLTGAPPFGSDESTTFHVQDCHVRMPPPPLVYVNPEVPPAVGAVVLRCLEKEPAQRYQTCTAVMNALEAAMHSEALDTAESLEPIEEPTEEPPPAVVTGGEVGSSCEPAHKVVLVQRASDTSPLILDRDVTPKPQEIPSAKALDDSKENREPKRQKVYLVGFAVAAVILIVAGAIFYSMRSKDNRLRSLQAKDWSAVRYDDNADFDNCMGVAGCLKKKAEAYDLSATDWTKVHYDDPLLKDCMGYAPCVDRRQQADKLVATDWKRAADRRASGDNIFEDCMGYAPCLAEAKIPVRTTKPTPAAVGLSLGRRTPIPSTADEDLTDCCSNAANPARCRAAKKAEGIEDNCHPLMGHN